MVNNIWRQECAWNARACVRACVRAVGSRDSTTSNERITRWTGAYIRDKPAVPETFPCEIFNYPTNNGNSWYNGIRWFRLRVTAIPYVNVSFAANGRSKVTDFFASDFNDLSSASCCFCGVHYFSKIDEYNSDVIDGNLQEISGKCYDLNINSPVNFNCKIRSSKILASERRYY